MYCTLVGAVLEGAAISGARNAAGMFAAFHRTRHRQIPDGAAVYIAEQADIMRAAVDGQIFDGMALAVKCAGVGRRPRIKGITNADWRPCFAVQINVFRQFGADFGVWFLCCIIHLIPEPFQPLGGANSIGVCLRAAAGGKRGGAGNPAAKCAAGNGSVVGDLAGKRALFDDAVVIEHRTLKLGDALIATGDHERDSII